MRGRNTKKYTIGEYEGMANYQRKHHIILKFMHYEKHICFNSIGVDRRKKEIYDGAQVMVAI